MKVCARCGTTFERTRGVAPSQFERRKYCSRVCSDNLHESVDVEVVELLRKATDFAPMGFEEIADVMGVSKQRVCQIYTRAIRKMRRELSRKYPDLITLHGFDINGHGDDMHADWWK